jgi:aldehyde:ferredoxin oxidoreductase
MDGGYAGQILYVDLNSGNSRTEPLDRELAHQFIGGRGLGARMLWDELGPGADPSSPESPIMFLTGPLTGIVPAGAQTCIVFKSPKTNITLGHPITGAHWGPELKFAGYDGVVVVGKSDKAVYLFIDDGSVEVRDAAHLWRKGILETWETLREELGPRTRIMCIGPAGENGVLYSSVHAEPFRSAARGGGGYLMGSKKLKAVAVRGTGSINIARKREFKDLLSLIVGRIGEGRRTSQHGYPFSRWGSYYSGMAWSDMSTLDVKNFREGYWHEIDKISVLQFEWRNKVKSRGCYGCPLACMQHGVIREGSYAGNVVNPDFDSTQCIGAGCLVTDLDSLLYLHQFGDDLGFDNISLGGVTGFAMECYEKGVLTKNDLDGIELTWGNVPAILELWKKILNRDGIGELLAQGVREASEKIGQGAEKFAMHTKGLEYGAYTGQKHHARALQYAVGDRGGCHHFGQTWEEQNARVWSDSLLMCTWVRPYMSTPSFLYIDLLNAVTGWNLASSDFNTWAERMLIMARSYNIREGMKPLKDDVVPERVHSDAFTQGPEAGSLYPRDEFVKDRADFYHRRGCDDNGIPTDQHLTNLGLDFVIPVIREMKP